MITSNNIKSMTIIAACDNGQHLLAKVSEDNKGLINVIVGNTQWYVLKPDMVEQYSLAELAEAFRAMEQLMSIRDSWIKDWKPNWCVGSNKWCIIIEKDEPMTQLLSYTSHPLSFPTREMATDFMNTFKDLLEIAKPLI